MLVANAGITDDTLLMRMTEEQFTRVIDANLTGAFRVRQARQPGDAARPLGPDDLPGFGRRRWPVGPGQINYAASKAGVIGMARSITRELGSRSITANVVAPGFIETDMTAELSRRPARAPRRSTSRCSASAQPEDVAAVVSFLASDDSAYVSGAVIPVDGGMGMGH